MKYFLTILFLLGLASMALGQTVVVNSFAVAGPTATPTPTPVPITLVSATVASNGTTLTLVFSEAVTVDTNIYADWAAVDPFSIEGAAHLSYSSNYASGDTTTAIVFSVTDGPVLSTDVVHVAGVGWGGASGNFIIDTATGLKVFDLGGLVDFPVTNNSVQ